MIPWTLLDTAKVPGDGGELRLLQRGAEFSIRLGRNELMNSRVHGSEEALATIAIAKIGDYTRPRILIGGLGKGFTLRAALRVIGAEARVVVAELVPLGWPNLAAWECLQYLPRHARQLGDVHRDQERLVKPPRPGRAARQLMTQSGHRCS